MKSDPANLASAFQQALSAYRKGQFPEAWGLCEHILTLAPDSVDALNLSGAIAWRRWEYALAAELFGKAILLNPGHAAAYVNQGAALQMLGRLDDALDSYDRAIEIDTARADAYYNRGDVLQKLGRLDEALESYGRTIRIDPANADAHNNRGVVLLALNRLQEALDSHNRAVDLRPDSEEAHYNRGNTLRQLGRMEEALSAYDRAIAIRCDYAEAISNRGNILRKLGRLEEALSAYDRAIAIRRDFAEAFSNRGNVLHDLNRLDEALDSLNRAIYLSPDFADAYCNRGKVLHHLNRLVESLEDLNRAIDLKPDFADAYCSRGNTELVLGLRDAALESFNRARAIKPDHATALWNLSLLRLLTGDFANGWKDYERRWDVEALGLKKRDFAQPLWLGDEPVAGKTILLHSEQGLGDTLQFCRFAKRVAELGATVILLVQRPLAVLLSTLDGVSRLVADGDPLPAFDIHCPLLSLPLAFKVEQDTIPSANAYIRADPDKIAQWRERLGKGAKPRIGLAWSGSTIHRYDHKRSIPLGDIVRYLPDGFQYVSLQKDLRDADRDILAKHPELLHFGDELEDFADTAALCELMDLVVSVDTAVAHLAGALGKKVWVLLPYAPDWRWLLNRNDSPWYPSCRLFRQTKIDDWQTVLEQLKLEIGNGQAV